MVPPGGARCGNRVTQQVAIREAAVALSSNYTELYIYALPVSRKVKKKPENIVNNDGLIVMYIKRE